MDTSRWPDLCVLVSTSIRSCILCNKSKIKNIGLNFFEYNLLYTAYTDDATFFLKDQKSVFKILNIFHKNYLNFPSKT